VGIVIGNGVDGLGSNFGKGKDFALLYMSGPALGSNWPISLVVKQLVCLLILVNRSMLDHRKLIGR
jgi:hypothetical protein